MAVRDGIIIPDPLPLDRCVRARQSFFVDMGFAPGSPGTRQQRLGISGFGRSIQEGQLVLITDPIVRAHPEYFETVPRLLTREDVERHCREIERDGKEAA
jgi:hypothetical protein